MVDPEVYTKLDALTKRIEELKSVLHEKQGRDEYAFTAMFATKLAGTVYVQVLLRPNEDVSEIERRVLRSLKGSEFYAAYLFNSVPALVGYATREGLSKLAANPDVTGVCLDDQPLPRSEHLTGDMFQAASPNEAVKEEPGIREGKVEPAVYRAIARTERVNVMISLRSDSLPKETGEQSTMWARGEEQKQASMQLQNGVLDGVNADDFWLQTRTISAPMIFGQITREGVHKLCANPDVKYIHLPRKGVLQ